MKNFKDYVKNKESNTGSDIQKTVESYSGKSESELLQEIMGLADKGKKDGSLTEESIKNFEETMSPLLNEEQKAKLKTILDSIRK